MKTWQELSKEYEILSDACNDKKGELQAALITELKNKFPDFIVVPDYDIHDQNMSSIIADGKEFHVGDYRCNDPELFRILPDYPEIEELLYLWSL